MMVCKKLMGLGVLLVLLTVASCGKSGTPPTAKVTGTVTYQGQPLEGVSVAFIPESGRPASGKTDTQGNFTLSTFDSGDGAVLGMHKVVVGETVDPPKRGTSEAKNWKPPKPRVPLKYSDPKTSGLTATVDESGENHFTFDLLD